MCIRDSFDIFGGSCTDPLLPMRAKFGVLEQTEGLHLQAKFHLNVIDVYLATYHICFYDIQWKRIRGIPFILKSHNNTDTTRMWANSQRDGRPVEHRWRPAGVPEK